MRTKFKIVGLSKPKCITCETDKQDTFIPNSDILTQDRFDALWDLLTGNWNGKIKCIVDHKGFDNSGMPIEPIFIEVTDI